MRLPADLKERLAREVERDGPEPERRRRRHPRRALRRPLRAERPAGAGPGATGDVLLRMPRELKDELDAPRLAAPAATNDLDRRDARGGPRPRHPKGHHGKHQRLRTARRAATTRSASPSSASATAPTRCSRASSTTRTRPDDEFVPGLMHVDLGGYHVRDIEFTAAFDVDEGQGRQGPGRGDLGAPERHDQVRRRAEDRDQGLARDDARRHRQVPLRGRRRRRPARPTTSSGSSRRPAPTSSSTTSRSAPRRRRSGTRSRSSRPAARW